MHNRSATFNFINSGGGSSNGGGGGGSGDDTNLRATMGTGGGKALTKGESPDILECNKDLRTSLV